MGCLNLICGLVITASCLLFLFFGWVGGGVGLAYKLHLCRTFHCCHTFCVDSEQVLYKSQSLRVCSEDHVKLGHTLTHFLQSAKHVFGTRESRETIWHKRPGCARVELFSRILSYARPSVRCCSGWVRERSCLLWRRSESRGIPASSPTRLAEPPHRCSPKVSEALWFCGSSMFLDEALS